MQNDDDQIDTREAARLIGITKRAVIYAIEAGKIEARPLSRQWIVSRTSALAYAAERERRAEAKGELK